MLSVIPAHLLSGFELARLGHNLVAAVHHDRDACRPDCSANCSAASAAGNPEPPRNDDQERDDEHDDTGQHDNDGTCVCSQCDTDTQVESAMRSEHVAS